MLKYQYIGSFRMLWCCYVKLGDKLYYCLSCLILSFKFNYYCYLFFFSILLMVAYIEAACQECSRILTKMSMMCFSWFLKISAVIFFIQLNQNFKIFHCGYLQTRMILYVITYILDQIMGNLTNRPPGSFWPYRKLLLREFSQ